MIRTIRGVRIMFDRDVAKNSWGSNQGIQPGCKTKYRQRLPEDFMFRLTQEEAKALRASRSQNVTSSRPTDHRGAELVFTSPKSEILLLI
jgi:ORF6N domain-containing protein